jgi:broad specificity phosphatase PhoE
MSHLTVVRHGQARSFEADSDRLSEIGELQAQALRHYWERHGIEFDEVLSGALVRHRRTAELAHPAAAEVSPNWNEYDAEGILRPHPRPASFPDNRGFQKMFEKVMLDWIAGSAGDHESWAGFRDRVLEGLRRIQAGPPDRRVVLFTSGGPIGVLVQTALNAPERSFLEVNWRVRNCSITEFVFSIDRFTLDSFNAIPHLTDPALRTFR